MHARAVGAHAELLERVSYRYHDLALVSRRTERSIQLVSKILQAISNLAHESSATKPYAVMTNVCAACWSEQMPIEGCMGGSCDAKYALALRPRSGPAQTNCFCDEPSLPRLLDVF